MARKLRHPEGPIQGRTKLKVVFFEKARGEARRFLTEGQCLHVEDLARRLEDFGDPTATQDLRIDKVGNLWELKEKGGLLGRINVRVFFGHVPSRGEIVVLGVFKKEREGATPRDYIIKMENRLNHYVSGLT